MTKQCGGSETSDDAFDDDRGGAFPCAARTHVIIFTLVRALLLV